MITSGVIHQKYNIKENEHETYMINLKNIAVSMEVVNDNLCLTLENKANVKADDEATITNFNTDNSRISNI